MPSPPVFSQNETSEVL